MRDLLPAVELSCNPALSLWTQTATLFDEPPALHVTPRAGARALRVLGLARLWAQQQETVLTLQAIHDAYVRLDWHEPTGQVRYRPVTPNFICEVVADPDLPHEPIALTELRPREIDGQWLWCWERWDVSRPDAPVFVVEAEERGIRRDVTAQVWTPRDGETYPYHGRDGRPVLPYQVYHSRLLSGLWSPQRGEELVDGTYTAAALATMWLGGMRDGSHPQRAVVDGEIVTPRGRPVGAHSQQYHVVSPMHILPVRSTGEGRTARLDQWQPTMDPEAAGRAIAAFIAQNALYAGVSAADVSVSSQGLSRTSGHAIEVSREGQRKARKRIIPPMHQGDTALIAKAATLANAYGGTSLPERPDAYQVVYADVPRTTQELRAEAEALEIKRRAGGIRRIDVIMALNPHLSEDQARDRLAEILAEDAMVAAAQRLIEEEPHGRRADPDPEPELADAPADPGPPGASPEAAPA